MPNAIHRYIRSGLRLTAAVAFSSAAIAQVIPVGSIDGVLRDPSSAVIPQAKITAVHIQTTQARSTVSDEQGRYFLPQLRPGNYRLSAEKPGFQTASIEAVVETGRKVTIDLSLHLGTSTESVQVTGEAPVIEAGSASLGSVVNSRQILDLPLSGRNPLRLAFLSPGITTTVTPGSSSVTDISGSSYFSTSGANTRQNEFYIDGVPNTIQDRVLYIPTADAVAEFNVQTNPLDAEFGHGGGAYINLTTRSGTNQIHGTVFEFLKNDALNANNFFLNRSGAKKAPLRYNQFGFTAGGPIIRDKTFWFFMYEGIRQVNGASSILSTPTELQRQGDFSQTFSGPNTPINIFDPFSTRPNPSNPNQQIRDPFPGNRIPATRIDPVARAIAALYPMANLAGQGTTGLQNYLWVRSGTVPTNAYVTRVDHSLGNRHRLSGRFSTNKTLTTTPHVVDIGSIGGGTPSTGNNRVQTSIGVSDTITISPSTIVSVQAGFARWTQEGLTPIYDPAKLNLPSSFANTVQEQIFPTIGVANYLGMGNEGNWFEHTNTLSAQTTITQVKGRHSLKYGFQLQPKRNNYQLAQRPSGTFAFGQAFTQGPDPNARGANIGHGFASLLLGTPDSGAANIRAAYSFQGNYYGWFIQDDIKVTQRLTLNIGLRYELQPNVTERYNRSVRGFDLTTPNPVEQAARANYARNPVPELPVDQFRVRGGMIFATPEDRGNGGIVEKNMFAPRIGLAYRVGSRTVLRAGYGLFRSFWWQVSSTTEGTGAETTTTMVSSRDGITPFHLLRNPFPDGLVQPTNTSAGLATLLGSAIQPFAFDKRFPYNYRWNFGIQRELVRNVALEVNYVGNTGMRLPVGSAGREQDRDIGFLPAQYLSLGSALNTQVANPFFGIITIPGPLSQPTISRSQLLSTYPQFTSIRLLRQTEGKSYYHSLQSSINKRYSHGIQLGGTYTWSKQIEKLRYIDVTDPGPSKMIGEFDRPHRVTTHFMWELPVGRGKALGVDSAVLDKVVGGWQLNGVYVFQSGGPIFLGNMVPTGASPKLDAGERSVDRWYNTAAFTVFPAFTVRTLPNTLASLRNDAQNQWDFSLLKTTNLVAERVRLQFRFEMINALNQVQFGNPTINPGSPVNGTITGQANAPREIQLGLKLIF
jgi:hypothetical protein